MRKFVIAIVLGILYGFSGFAFASYNCSSEIKSYNGTSGLWDAHYAGCILEPLPFNSTNITVLNVTVVNVTNVTVQALSCSQSDIISNISAVLGHSDFNLTDKYVNAYTNWNTCLQLYHVLLNESSTYKASSVSNATYNQTVTENDMLRRSVLDLQNSINQRAFIGFGVGILIAYYFWKYRPESLKPHEVLTQRGTGGFNMGALQRDQELNRLQNRLDELEAREKKGKKK